MADATTQAPSVRDVLLPIERAMLEAGARAQAAGATTVALPLPMLQQMAQDLMRAIMTLEAGGR